jgi:hypothetical protein
VNEFPKIYDIKESKRIWKEQSDLFRGFWENRIMNDEGDLSEDEMILIVQILDIVGRRRNEHERKLDATTIHEELK